MSSDANQKMSEVEIIRDGRERLASAVREVVSRHLVSSTPAVLCLRLFAAGPVLITPVKPAFEHLVPADLSLITLNGDIQETPDASLLPPELTAYLQTFRDRGDLNALGHFHPPYSNQYGAPAPLFARLETLAISQTGELLPVECKECPTRFTGLCSCRTDFNRHYSGARALLLKDNGFITMGADLQTVIQMADMIEQTVKNHHTQSPDSVSA